MGNVRVSFARNQDGSPEVLDTNDYYPFGMNFLNSDLVSYLAQPWSKYKYNGKELQETGMYAMDFRHYMPDIGRFTGIDRLTELAPGINPYRFGFNNPINFSDPTGLFETRKEAREYRREHDIRGSINRAEDGSYAINDKSNGVSYTKGTEASQETFANDGVQESVLLTGKKSENNGLNNLSKGIGYGGLAFTGMEQLPGSFRLTNGAYNGSQVSLKYYQSAWTGGSKARISTYNIGKVAKGAGHLATGVGSALDAYGVYNYYKNPQSSFTVRPINAGYNAGVAAYGIWANPIAGAVLSAVEVFYPGGMIGDGKNPGYINDGAQLQSGLDYGFNKAGPYRINLVGAHEPK